MSQKSRQSASKKVRWQFFICYSVSCFLYTNLSASDVRRNKIDPYTRRAGILSDLKSPSCFESRSVSRESRESGPVPIHPGIYRGWATCV